MNYNVFSYLVYLVITVGLTVWVARKLLKNGEIFLIDIFKGDHQMAGSVNNLLQVGFYLINIGYTLSVLTIYETLFNLQTMLESLSVKVGTIILILGVMHFFNLFVLFKLRSKNKIEAK